MEAFLMIISMAQTAKIYIVKNARNGKKGGGCPHQCINPEFKKVIEKKRMVTKLKFKCIKGCGAEIKFNDIKNHNNSECIRKKKTMQLMNREEISEYCQKKVKISYLIVRIF